MNIRSIGRLAVIACAVAAFGMSVPLAGYAQAKGGSRPEEVEWTWEVRPPQPDSKLPNVLLLGDSISRNYYPEVQKELSGTANVYLFASSISVGDPRLEREIEEFGRMEGVAFRVIHFNNGMHGWAYSEAEYDKAFPAFLKAIRRLAPKASLVWASTTPVRGESQPGPTNARIAARNDIAQRHLASLGIPLDDQHKLMLQHADTYEDNVHFNPVGAQIQGKQVVESIRALLKH